MNRTAPLPNPATTRPSRGRRARRNGRWSRPRSRGSRVPGRREPRACATSPSRLIDASPSAVSASAFMTRSPCSVPAEPSPSRPGRRPSPSLQAACRRHVTGRKRRTELERPNRELPGRRVRLACDRALGGFDERIAGVCCASSSGAAPSSSTRNSTAWSRWYARISTSLARSLCQPLGEARVMLGRSELAGPRRRPSDDECRTGRPSRWRSRAATAGRNSREGRSSSSEPIFDVRRQVLERAAPERARRSTRCRSCLGTAAGGRCAPR